MKAYLSSSHLRYLHDGPLKAAHLFFRFIYLPCDLRAVRWSVRDRQEFLDRQAFLGSSRADWPTEVVTAKFLPKMFADHEMLKRFYGHNPRTLEIASRRLGYVRNLDDTGRMFFQELVDGPGSLEHGVHCPSVSLFQKCADWLMQLKGEARVDSVDMYDLIAMYQDLFIAAFLWERYHVATLMTGGEIMLRFALLEAPDQPLWDNWGSDDSVYWRQFVSAKTVHELIGVPPRGVEPTAISTLMVPDIAAIPINELVEFILTDRPAPIYEFISAFVRRHQGALSHRQLANEVAEALFKVTRVLWPSLGETAIGLLGNAPTPLIVNPLGVTAWFRSALTKRRVDRDYSWVLAVNGLRALPRSRRR